MSENQIMIRAGMKRHKRSFIGIGILLLLTAFSLTTVLMTSLVGNRYIREEMERAGFGDLTAWAADVPDMDFLLESIREQDGVEDAKVQRLIFSAYEANGVESDSEGQMIPWTSGSGRYRFFEDDLSGHMEAPEGIREEEVYVSPSMKSMMDLALGDTVTFLNYYDWYFQDAKELYEILEEAGTPVMVMEPVHGGLLADLTEEAAKELLAGDTEKSQASWAMGWVMALPNVQVVLSGMSDESQVIDNIRTFSEARPLTEEDQERIQRAARIQHSDLAVACTGCRYCTPNCPQGLDIPFLLKNYNEAKIGGVWRIGHLKELPQEKQPAACIGCGVCAGHCPQGFHIPQILKELNKMLEEN